MANYLSARHSLLVLSEECDEKMNKKIEVLASRVKKLASLRKDTTEDRVLLMAMIEDHRKYITMLDEDLERTMGSYLYVVANMDQRTYDNGCWKVADKYPCKQKDFTPDGKSDFGWYSPIYVFTPKSWKWSNVCLN